MHNPYTVEFNHQDVLEKFRERYTGEPMLVRAPARINLIGEHTDYNDGFVMPAAIHYATWFAFAEATDNVTEIYSMKYEQAFQVNLANVRPVKEPMWTNYLLGVIRQLLDKGHALRPFKCVFAGDIPIGAGLSSSASVECGFAFGLNELNKLGIDRQTLVLMAQWSEHNFVGMKCGIMDQFASMMGKKGNVILLDCRSLTYSYSPLVLGEYALVLCDTRVKHALVDSDYNKRREDCEQGVAVLKKHYPHVASLRDADLDMVRKHAAEFSEKQRMRCTYVIEEIERVQQANEDLQNNNLEAFGRKMFETHHGLSTLYEVSCPELDFFVEIAKQFPEVIGARMMGGGFGGCTLNVVHQDAVDRFSAAIRESYERKFNRDALIHSVEIEDGVSLIK
jgi:galactokinase